MTTYSWKQGQAFSRNLCSNLLKLATIANGELNTNCKVCAVPTQFTGLDVEKTTTAVSDPWTDPGASIEYEVTVTNNTGEALTNVVLTDALNTSSPVTIGNMAIAATSVQNYTHLITAGNITDGFVSNTATVTGDGATDQYGNLVVLVVDDPSP